MYRPPVGIPRREQTRWQGWLISLLAHLLLLLLLFVHAREPDIDLGHRQGAGGAGPAGGGGGGFGNGGPVLRFVQIAPPATVPVGPAVIIPPVVPPPIKPLPTVVPPKAPPVAPSAPVASVKPAPTTPSAASPSPGAGTGAGLGQNLGAGAGPGSGGGVGSGEGAGRGSATGPGTGGGLAKNYPPTPRQIFLPPLPPPAKVRGFRLTAWFDVDSTGKATLLRFTPTPDGDYNKKLRETLASVRFRPAVRPDGVPVRDTVDVQFLF